MQNQDQIVKPFTISVTLPAKTKLSYFVPGELGGGLNYLILEKDYLIDLPEGFRVEIGIGARYIAVKNLRDNINKYPKNPIANGHVIILPAGTMVRQGTSIGMPSVLPFPFEVNLLNSTLIKLQNETFIQHTNSLVSLKTCTETEAKLNF